MDIHWADTVAEQALAWIAQGQADQALSALAEVVLVYPDVDRFVFRLGMAAESVSDVELALKCYKRAVGLHSSFGIFHHALIRVLLASRSVQQAVSEYRSTVDFDTLPQDIIRHFAQSIFEAGASVDLVFENASRVFGLECEGVFEESDAQMPIQVVRIIKRDNAFKIGVRPDALKRRLISSRLMALAVYLDRLARSNVLDSSVFLSLDDLPPSESSPVLCFCGYAPNHILIPDCIFLESEGYHDLKKRVEANQQPWTSRVKRAYWRGALTGVAQDLDEVLRLPRVQLAKKSVGSSVLDAKITDTTQFNVFGEVLKLNLMSENLLGPRDDEVENLKYQVLIDVDGNSNAWSGFFLKLICGAPTIKIMSQYRQWFYDRLEGGVHFVPIKDIETELIPSIADLLSDQSRSMQMAKSAQEVTMAMSLDSEYPIFEAGFCKAATMSAVGKTFGPAGEAS